jgi:hypothetical protein
VFRRSRLHAVTVFSVVLLTLAAPTAASATVSTSASATATATAGGVAWTVQTADNDQGSGRANFTYDVAPGAVISDAMIVVNTGTESLPLAVYAADAFTASSGEIDVLVDGTPSQGAGTWVAVASPPLTLAPGQSAEVPFTITVPTDARPGDHAAGIVTSLSSTDASSTLSVDRRLGTRINLRVAGELAPAAAVSAVSARYEASWNPFASGRLVVQYALENSGNTRLTGVETIATTGLGGSRTAPAQIGEIIPGSTVEVVRDVPAFSLGWISGSVSLAPEGVGLGAAALAPVTSDFSVAAVPWSLYALLLVILAGALVTVLLTLRARRRHAAPAAE